MNWNAIIYDKGQLVEIPAVRFYYNKKEKRYVGANIDDSTEEMFKSFLEKNGNKNYPNADAFILPLGNKCLEFKENSEPILYANGEIRKLYETSFGYKDSTGSLQLFKFFTDEFHGEIIGYQVHYEDEHYLVICGQNLNWEHHKHLFKMLDKRLSYMDDIKAHMINYDDCDYDMLIDYTDRKDRKREARKEFFRLLKTDRSNKEAITKAFNKWKMLH